KDRAALFQKFGELVHQVDGNYIAAMDSGVTTKDMDEIRKSTPYVTCTSDSFGDGDPSPYTALGVLRGMEATVEFRTGSKSLSGLHVAIQGVGHVGFALAKLLHEAGVRLTVCDHNKENTDRCEAELNAEVVAKDAIFDVPCDIFSPCALGGAINEETIDRLQTKMIVGSANNQLSKMALDQELHNRDISYAPDFLVNAGGLIHVAGLYDYGDDKKARDQIIKLYDETLNLFERAKQENKPTNQIAVQIAEERLNG
ncbi:MAG: amino acid dehydrogenase, partial [Coxiellaceae bacterium]|nr:amino acid dehydrogenase [Coxiellaceae bacterium]